jgi:hypothetical protein
MPLEGKTINAFHYFNQKRYEEIWNNKKLTTYEKGCNHEFLDLLDFKNLFLKSELNIFKIYQN